MFLVKEEETGYVDGYYETYGSAYEAVLDWKQKRPGYFHRVVQVGPEFQEVIPDNLFLPIRYAEDELKRTEHV